MAEVQEARSEPIRKSLYEEKNTGKPSRYGQRRRGQINPAAGGDSLDPSNGFH